MTQRHVSPWVTVAGTAEYSGYHIVTVRTALEHGQLHGHQRQFRGRWRIHIDAVDAWLAGENSVAACGCSEVARRRSRQRAAS